MTCLLEPGGVGVGVLRAALRLATDGFPSEMSSVYLSEVGFLGLVGGGEGEEGGTSGGGSVFFWPVGVFPCRALWALWRSKMGGNHEQPRGRGPEVCRGRAVCAGVEENCGGMG